MFSLYGSKFSCLVDKEGYPLPNCYELRLAKHNLHRLYNDQENIINELLKALENKN